MRLEDTHCHTNNGEPHVIQEVRFSREPINPSYHIPQQKPHDESTPFTDFIETFECILCGRRSKFNRAGKITLLMGEFKGV